ncbi:succinate-semialdehyde dehydrogenase, mitochondrial [Vigna radiata var. radiata]|uniref:Succinate-semialdehyde dehydrogenase n=1 Tax=Vigna radiata var. radiata TaxID=3916 RepID=A0A1S3U4X5_VIGRR|nr:succinate-semialdehyde dehydrogenase, mitochondrial [Vigna radiata var. radiata]
MAARNLCCMALRSSKLLSRPSHLLSVQMRTQTQMLSSSLPLIRKMSMDAQSVASKLNSSGLLRTQGLIGGKWSDAYDGKTIKVYNPATGESIADVACMGGRETNDAISAAYTAYRSWSKTTAAERSKFLRKWYDLLMAHKEELAQLITLEQGKTLKESIGEINYGAGFIEFSAEEAKRVYGDIIPAPLSDRRLFVLKQPVGVVGAITPWNFPLAMITRKVGPALACGCTVVIKPSELTPLTALAAAELSIQAGIPAGVVNVVMGNAPEIGDSLLASPQVRKITFTGSTAVGKKLMAGSAETVKKVSLELGGNAPCIVFDDADLDVAVKGTLAAKFRNSGQTCVCANRIIVQDGIYEKFANALRDAVLNMKVGDGFSEDVAQGPLINEAAVQKVESLIHDATSKGAKVILGGKRHSLGFTFYEPTVISDVNIDMRISREEVFGPVAPLLRFKTEEDAIRIANDTNAGLGSYVFTNSIQRSWRVAEALEYGLVGVNEGVISTEVAPFGGFKQSGLGREGSKYGMDEYLEIKYVCMGNMNKE